MVVVRSVMVQMPLQPFAVLPFLDHIVLASLMTNGSKKIFLKISADLGHP